MLLDISATGEENVIENNGEMNDLAYRRKQLQQMQDEVVDIEDVHGGISITDFTFNDFKMDLMEYLKEHESVMKQTPTGIHAVTKTNIENLKEGVIFCLKQRKKNKKEEHYNPINPYFLTYISSEGELIFSFTQSKKILDMYQKLSSSEPEVFMDLVNDFKKETKQGKDMSAYVDLLEVVVQEIVGKGIASLFTAGGTASLYDEIRSLDDFEVISYLVIKN